MSETTAGEHIQVGERALVSGSRRAGLYAAVKRAMDIAVVLTLMPFALPAIALLAFLVARDGGPAFHVQNRLGRDRRVFPMWKLRTMVLDADNHLKTYLAANPAASEEWASKQKLAIDPRVTPVGRFLRKYSLDELPQLFNVLRGEMSLVGPRPMLVDQRDLYPRTEYYEMRPGITGLWQVSERNLCSFAERAHYDSQYLSMIGFGADMRILWRTASVVLRGTGV